jgi:hypothetical protein
MHSVLPNWEHHKLFCNVNQVAIPAEVSKVKQSLYTPWRRLGERRYSSYSFSTSALDGGEWSASRPGRAFTPGERTPGTHCTGGWVSPRAGLDTEARGKILCPCQGSNPDRPVVQPVVRHLQNKCIRQILIRCWWGRKLLLSLPLGRVLSGSLLLP